VSLTQKWQVGVIFAGMVTAFFVLVSKFPADLGFSGAAHLAGALGKLEAVDWSFDPGRRYTVWSGVFGGLFLSLSYFGTDQSQVQRYIGGASLRESRLGLVFNALVKIPMQFCILLLGALVFVFYQFQPAPVFHNRVEWQRHVQGEHGETFRALEERHAALHLAKQARIAEWQAARGGGDPAAEAAARAALVAANDATDAVRAEAKQALRAADPNAPVKDSDYVFISFIVAQLPPGVVGLLVAVMIAAALGSKAGELNALGTTSTIDFWRHSARSPPMTSGRNVRVAKWFTASGAFSPSASRCSPASRKISSRPSTSRLHLLRRRARPLPRGFLSQRVGGTAVFWGAVAAQSLIFALFFLRHATRPRFSYLWYNLIWLRRLHALQPDHPGPAGRQPAARAHRTDE